MMNEILKRRGYTRREFHATLAKLGLGFTAVAGLARPGMAAEGNNLTVFEWAGYDVPELFPQYVEKYGAGPEFALFGSEEEALQKLLAGFQVDLAHPCSYNIKRWREAGVAGPIDTARLTHWNDIWEQFRNIPDQTFEEQTYFVPLDCGNSSIAYRTDLMKSLKIVDHQANGHAPKLRDREWEAKIMIDATLHYDMPPVALPARELMEEARTLYLQELF